MANTPKTPMTDEHRAKIAAAKLGKPRLFSKNPEATRAKMRARMLGNTYPTGHRHSQATKDKMRETWAAKKAAANAATLKDTD